MKSKVHGVRFDDEKDRELLRYIEKAGGFTNAVYQLWQFYENHQQAKRIEDIIESKLSNIKISGVVASTTSQEIEDKELSQGSKKLMNSFKNFGK